MLNNIPAHLFRTKKSTPAAKKPARRTVTPAKARALGAERQRTATRVSSAMTLESSRSGKKAGVIVLQVTEPKAAKKAAAPQIVTIDNIPVIQREGPAAGETPRSPYDSDTAISLYMRHVGEVPLLTVEEEIALAARIRQGDETAREHMIRANLRLVVKIAREYDNLGLPLLDLINEGNIGLIKAVERFDPAKGGKLSTYGSWWIKQSIRRALANQSKTIRLPVHVVDKLCKIRRVANLLHEELGREATDEELAKEMNMPAWRIAEMRAASVRPASLEAPMGDDETSRLGDIVEDENAIDPFEELQDKTMTHMILDMVEELPEREATILRHRFGLDGGQEKTLEEVGQKFGVTRERIRQLQNIALGKLRRMIEKLESIHQPA